SHATTFSISKGSSKISYTIGSIIRSATVVSSSQLTRAGAQAHTIFRAPGLLLITSSWKHSICASFNR
ncbi:hypothetical protein, partial [Lysinibacillus agricola]|uniref:hypothetical protein n=1 Tax=Lysinibacillus agricola TaxID=2590012 RepID=UPI003C2E9C51